MNVTLQSSPFLGASDYTQGLDRRSVGGQSALESGAPRARDQFFFLFEIFFRHMRVCYFVATSLTRRRICKYCCCWVSSAESLGTSLWQVGGWGYFTTDGQSVSMPWYRSSLWDLRPDITSWQNVSVWNLESCFCGAPSLTRGRVSNLQCNHPMVRVAQNP
jgi:hypothetical protein